MHKKMTAITYQKRWQATGSLQIKMIEKTGTCRYKLGQTFYYKTPYKKPRNACNALLHVLDLYTWRVALGFPSWEADDRSVFRIHCPSKKGTVWELRKVKKA